jgi:hypothetical protein
MPANSLVIGLVGLVTALGAHGLQPAPDARTVAKSAGRSATASPKAFSILPTGSLHGDEVPDDAAGEWFALVSEGNGATLSPVRVSLVPEEDMMDRDGEETGRRVEVEPPLGPIVLVRGLPPFTGQVTTAMLDQAVDVSRGVEAGLNGVSTRLLVRCVDAPPVSGQRQQKCALMAQSDGIEQALFTYSAFFDGTNRVFADRGPFVSWAGDLDLDGSLDLLLDTSDHDNVEELRLFLSSPAKPGELVSEVALFRHTGC